MNGDQHKASTIFRRVGSNGLIIFERDGVLLKRRFPRRDFMLTDINDEILDVLIQLRRQDIRFGFISDSRGMDVGSHGRSEFEALSRLLDKLLRVRKAMPDFWMAWGQSQDRNRVQYEGNEQPQRYSTSLISKLILQAIDWYEVDKRETIFVNNTSGGLRAAIEIDITGIQYSGMKPALTFRPQKAAERTQLFPDEHVETRQLYTEIQRILHLSR